MDKVLHTGHRERLRAKLSKGDIEPHELLELILFNALPRVNTNNMAHELIDKCGGIWGVFHTPPSKLTEVDGIGETAAIYIHAIGRMMGVCAIDACDTKLLATSERELTKYAVGLFLGEGTEKTYMLMFSDKGRFIGHEKIGDGFYFQNQVRIYDAVALAKRNNAKRLIIVHNHPSNVSTPSDTDIATSEHMDIAFSSIGAKIDRHCIVAGGDLIDFTDKVRQKPESK
jgi:DNA repair protein RadC